MTRSDTELLVISLEQALDYLFQSKNGLIYNSSWIKPKTLTKKERNEKFYEGMKHLEYVKDALKTGIV